MHLATVIKNRMRLDLPDSTSELLIIAAFNAMRIEMCHVSDLKNNRTERIHDAMVSLMQDLAELGNYDERDAVRAMRVASEAFHEAFDTMKQSASTAVR